MNHPKYLLTNVIAITMDRQRRILEQGAICWQEAHILQVGDSTELEQAHPDATRLDGGGNVLMPGFIEPLTVPGSGLLGRQHADNAGRWQTMLEAFADSGSPQEIEADGVLLANKALQLGITTVGVRYPAAMAESAVRVHQAAMSGCGLSVLCIRGLDALETSGKQADAFWLDAVLEKASDEEMRHFFQQGQRLFVRLTPDRLRDCAGALLDLLNECTVAVDCHGLGFSQLRRLANSGAAVVYTPNTWKPSAHVVEMLHQKIPVALSSWGEYNRNPLDLLQTARRAQLFDITQYDDYHILPYAKTLEMITCESAQVLGLGGSCGALEPGKRADFNLLNWKQAHLTPTFMPLQGCMGRASGRDVDTVVAAGRIVKQHGQRVHSLDPAVLATIQGR